MTEQAQRTKRSQRRHRMEVCGRFIDSDLSRAQFAEGEGMAQSTLHNWLVRPDIVAALGDKLSARAQRRNGRSAPARAHTGLVEVRVKAPDSVSISDPDVSLTLVAVTFKSMPTRAQLRDIIGSLTGC